MYDYLDACLDWHEYLGEDLELGEHFGDDLDLDTHSDHPLDELLFELLCELSYELLAIRKPLRWIIICLLDDLVN